MFHPAYHNDNLSEDGTQLSSDSPFTPPVDLKGGEKPYERMWAGATWEWVGNNPLKVDEECVYLCRSELYGADIVRSCTLTTTIHKVDRKKGQTGLDNVFVWLNSDIANASGSSIKEKRCILYRKQGSSSKAASGPKSMLHSNIVGGKLTMK